MAFVTRRRCGTERIARRPCRTMGERKDLKTKRGPSKRCLLFRRPNSSRPFFTPYRNPAVLRHGGDLPTYALLLRASQLEDIKPQELEPLSQERRKVVASISRYARAANFRRRVMDAYGNRRAVTRTQLDLVEAAHIVPVKAQGTDDVSNGLALSPTIHRAYDNSLIYLDAGYFVRLNEQQANALRDRRLGEGLEQMGRYLNSQIHLPAHKAQWPDPTLIERANRLRRIPGYC